MSVLDCIRVDEVRRMDARKICLNIFYMSMIVASGFVVFAGLKIVTSCEFPLVVDGIGSMKPAFHRGDLLVLTNHTDEAIRVGDIVVIKLDYWSMPLARRIIEVSATSYISCLMGVDRPPPNSHSLKINEDDVGNIRYLTKGDENMVDDRGLYEPGQKWLERRSIMGNVKVVVPYIGKVNLFMHDHPIMKYIMLACITLLVILHGDKFFQNAFILPNLVGLSVMFVERFGLLHADR